MRNEWGDPGDMTANQLWILASTGLHLLSVFVCTLSLEAGIWCDKNLS